MRVKFWHLKVLLLESESKKIEQVGYAKIRVKPEFCTKGLEKAAAAGFGVIAT